MEHADVHSLALLLLDIFPEKAKTPLMSDVVAVCRLIELKVLVMLVNSVVGQMHVVVLQIRSERGLVLLGRQSRQSFSI